MPSSPAIRVTQLIYRYATIAALDDLSFELEKGRFLALLGSNGAGKTTLFSLLTRLLAPSSGSIELFGKNLQQHPGAALRKIGVVFQQSTLDLDLTVSQNLHYHGALHGMSPALLKQRIAAELERFGLRERADHKVRALNGGHRRRVEIARALLHKPKLLLLDEATVGLDYDTRVSISSHIRELCSNHHIAVLWTTHLLEELQPDDDTLVLNNGRAVARGQIKRLQAEHGTDDIGALMSQLQKLKSTGAAP